MLTRLTNNQTLYLKLDLYYLTKSFAVMYDNNTNEREAIKALTEVLLHPENNNFWNEFYQDSRKELSFTRNQKVQYFLNYRRWGIGKTAKFLGMSTHTVIDLRDNPKAYIPTMLDRDLELLYPRWIDLQSRMKKGHFDIGLVD